MQKRVSWSSQHGYARTERVSSEIQRIIAASLERLYEGTSSEDVATVTSVVVDPDLRRARVYFDHISADLSEWLKSNRVRLQAEIARQMRIKRTPLLEFISDPAIESGIKIESILRKLDLGEDDLADQN